MAGAAVLLVLGGGGLWAAKSGALKLGAGTATADRKASEGKPAEITLMLAAADVAVAGPATLTQSLTVAGTVDAARQAIVRSRHAGFLKQVSKRAGDRVQAGERLAVVDSEELRLRIAERESALKQTQAALGVAESNRAQQRSLADRGFISKSALDAVESNHVAARSAFDAAKTNLDIARSSLAETTLLAPISGVISRRSVEPGERVVGEMAVFTILDPTSLEVVVPVAAERVAELKPGQTASFLLDAGGNAVEGTLTRIIPTTGSAARTVETRFALPSASTVPAGAFLSGQLRLSQSTAAVAVPRVAVKTDVNGSYVWTVQDGKAAQRRIKLAPSGDETSASVPVAQGLAAGNTVLTLRGTEPLEGQKVSMPGAAPPVPAAPASPSASTAAATPATSSSK